MAYKELTTQHPFIVNKNLGSAVDVAPEMLTRTTADGTPVIPLTQKQKYDFDRNGWLLIPSVLSESDIDEMRGFCRTLQETPMSIAEPERCALGGPLQKLADHSVIVGFLNEFLAYPPVASEDCYGFRLEETGFFVGQATGEADPGSGLRKGNGLFRLPGDSHLYRCVPGRGWSGLTRAVWTLDAVTEEANPFRFITGSHKAAYPIPEAVRSPESALWETYHCPAGSVFLFTEALTQTTVPMKVTEARTEPVCVWNLYNTVASRWSNWLPHPNLLETMPPKRRTLFREVYAGGNVVNGEFDRRTSAYSAEI